MQHMAGFAVRSSGLFGATSRLDLATDNVAVSGCIVRTRIVCVNIWWTNCRSFSHNFENLSVSNSYKETHAQNPFRHTQPAPIQDLSLSSGFPVPSEVHFSSVAVIVLTMFSACLFLFPYVTLLMAHPQKCYRLKCVPSRNHSHDSVSVDSEQGTLQTAIIRYLPSGSQLCSGLTGVHVPYWRQLTLWPVRTSFNTELWVLWCTQPCFSANFA
jgi:hypothetical protein